jgi:hypothetical protein
MTTVKECTKAKEWDNGKGQKVPIYKVELTDGTTGESFGKEIPVGTSSSEITIEEGQYGKKFKWAAPSKNGFGGGMSKKPNNAAFAIAYAKDLVIADKVKIDQLIATADKIFNWIESKNKS